MLQAFLLVFLFKLLATYFFRDLIKHVVPVYSKTEFLYGEVIIDQHNKEACKGRHKYDVH